MPLTTQKFMTQALLGHLNKVKIHYRQKLNLDFSDTSIFKCLEFCNTNEFSDDLGGISGIYISHHSITYLPHFITN